LLRDTATSFEKEPDWAPLLLESPEVLGVENFTETGVTVRMIAKTLPLKQWEVSRELRRRIKKRLGEEQIQLPQSRVKMIAPDEDKS
jgi:small conductance mechanosensitive channel